MKGIEFQNQCIYSHFLSFNFSFSLPHTSRLLRFFTHMHKYTEPSTLESKVPIAFLIRMASGRVSKSKLCELQSVRNRWTSEPCLSFGIVTFLHLVNSPMVWSAEPTNTDIVSYACVLFALVVLCLSMWEYADILGFNYILLRWLLGLISQPLGPACPPASLCTPKVKQTFCCVC